MVKKQRFVLLAGPHKTASSETQLLITKLSKTNLTENFVWPRTPNGNIYFKQYAGLINNLIHEANNTQTEKKKKSKLFYTNEFRSLWHQKKSIVIGAELLGTVSISPQFGENLIDGLLAMMPWEENGNDANNVYKNHFSKDHITVVLNFRMSRFDHLYSVSNQRKKMMKSKETFHDFVCSSNCSAPRYKLDLPVINTLAQAAQFRRKGLNVVVIDMEGVARDGLDATHTVACEVLDLPCLNGEVKAKPIEKVFSPKEKKITVNNEEREKLEKILQSLDCSYSYLRSDKNFTILHESSVFRSCDHYEPISEEQSCEKMKDVLMCPHRSNKSLLHEISAKRASTIMTKDAQQQQLNKTRANVFQIQDNYDSGSQEFFYCYIYLAKGLIFFFLVWVLMFKIKKRGSFFGAPQMEGKRS
mmetsp:Transcript_61190/g.73600  ORF Transcript_61190/g.73600 Transcript_61190/m.73600 type:complete len:415 (-) Transcript_61190:943-2187(-)